MDLGESARTGRGRQRYERVAAAHPGYEKLSAAQLTARLKQLENTMYTHARNLEFEDAARLRDEIAEIKQQYFKTSELEAV
jgi:excinuclease ABC subunit B